MNRADPPAMRPDTVLPARREDIELHTADGLCLVGELALPVDRTPVATLICLHPLPTHGGSMDSHVLRKAAFRLPAQAGVAVLRFNTRGTGDSAGAFDTGPNTLQLGCTTIRTPTKPVATAILVSVPLNPDNFFNAGTRELGPNLSAGPLPLVRFGGAT